MTKGQRDNRLQWRPFEHFEKSDSWFQTDNLANVLVGLIYCRQQDLSYIIMIPSEVESLQNQLTEGSLGVEEFFAIILSTYEFDDSKE